MQEYTFVLKYHSGVDNKSANRVVATLHAMNMTVVGFDQLKIEYVTCLEFGIIFRDVQNGNRHDLIDFVIRYRDGYLFKSTCLCILRISLRDFFYLRTSC